MVLKRTALAAAIVLASAGLAGAEPSPGWHHGMGPDHHGGVMELLRGVTLTDEQKAQVSEIEHAGWTAMKSNFEQMRSIHDQITNLLVGTAAVTKDQLETLTRQEEQLHAQADAARIEQVLAVRNILTPEQLAQAASVHQQMESLHQQEHALMRPE